jgi:hypothetical protein
MWSKVLNRAMPHLLGSGRTHHTSFGHRSSGQDGTLAVFSNLSIRYCSAKVFFALISLKQQNVCCSPHLVMLDKLSLNLCLVGHH